MTNGRLRRALLKKLKISHQALYQRVNKLKEKVSITTEDAIYVIAQQEGMILDKYLDKEIVDRVRTLMQQISLAVGVSGVQKEISRGKRKPSTTGERVIVIGKEFKVKDPILSAKTISEAKDMAAVYPVIYVFENSIREVINRIMTNKHGENWWETQAPKGLRETVDGRMEDEKRNSWHQRRGARPIDYLDLNQLPALMRKIEKDVVPDVIPSIDWFTQLVEEVYKSRCVVCHMNPLDKDNIDAVKVRSRHWQKQIKAKKHLIPEG